MKRSRGPKLTVAAVINDLRKQGYKPLFKSGRLVDWRRIRNIRVEGEITESLLETVEVTVHTSGRVTVQHRSSNETGRKRDREAGTGASSEAASDTVEATAG